MIDFKEMSIRSIFVGHIVDILFRSLILVKFGKTSGPSIRRSLGGGLFWGDLVGCCSFFFKILTPGPGIRQSLGGGLSWGYSRFSFSY